MKAAVLGSGTFGTALASILADKNNDTVLWTRREALAHSINTKHINDYYLPDLELPVALRAETDLKKVLDKAEIIVCAVPAQQIGGVLREFGNYIPEHVPIVGAAKGIEEGSLRLVSEIFEAELDARYHPYLSFLSGPSFAKEIIRKIPTVVSIASKNEQVAKLVQQIFFHSYFRTYWTPDVIGVEVGGALKNVIAIAAGVSDGLGLGHNTRAAIITRGLSEITRLGVAKGADPLTFLGLAGMGDLVLTCTGDLSRNRSVGIKLGQGKKLKEIMGEMKEVAEGVPTTHSAYELSKKMNIEMAITTEVYRLLYEDKDPRSVARDLMGRELKKEGI